MSHPMRAALAAACAVINAALPRETALPKGSPAAKIGVILGSGLGAWANQLKDSTAIPYFQIPGMPSSTVHGHAGQLVSGRVDGAIGGTNASAQIIALQGRVHSYEGHELAVSAFPARVLCALGCKLLVITNAAGGVDPTMHPGQLVIIRDHLNLMGGSPLRGANDDAVGPRFPDMTEAYAPRWRELAKSAGKAVGMELREGVYAALPGPQYETPSEVKMVRGLGADLVGMSTVPETIVARHMGVEVLGISCVTNLAAGVTGEKLSHDEVTETANRVSQQFMALLDQIVLRAGGAL